MNDCRLPTAVIYTRYSLKNSREGHKYINKLTKTFRGVKGALCYFKYFPFPHSGASRHPRFLTFDPEPFPYKLNIMDILELDFNIIHAKSKTSTACYRFFSIWPAHWARTLRFPILPGRLESVFQQQKNT